MGSIVNDVLDGVGQAEAEVSKSKSKSHDESITCFTGDSGPVTLSLYSSFSVVSETKLLLIICEFI